MVWYVCDSKNNLLDDLRKARENLVNWDCRKRFSVAWDTESTGQAKG